MWILVHRINALEHLSDEGRLANNKGSNGKSIMSVNDLLASGKAVITRTEAAQLLECDVRTVSRAIDKGEIEALPFGRKKMIPVRPLLKRLGFEA